MSVKCAASSSIQLVLLLRQVKTPDGQFKEFTGIKDKFYIDKYDTGRFLQFRV